MKKELEVLELENGEKLVVIDAISYQEKTYLCLGKLNEKMDDIVGDLDIVEKIDDEIIEVDEKLYDKLKNTFEKRLKDM